MLSRRLPVYLLLDMSGSMKDEQFQSMKVGLNSLVSALRQDPYALETVHLAITTFNREVEQLLALTPVETIQLPELEPPKGPSLMGKALGELMKQVKRDIVLTTEERKGDWMPLLFIMTDGKASDIMDFKKIAQEIRGAGSFGKIVACLTGAKAKVEQIKLLTDDIVSLETLDGNTLMAFFEWVTEAIKSGNKSMGATSSVELPPPPPEVNNVVI